MIIFILGFRESGGESSDNDELDTEDVRCGDEDLPTSESSSDEECRKCSAGIGDGVKNGIVQNLLS